MSIATKLTKLETDITSAYNAVQTKGGTVPANKNTDNLATAINSISGGAGKPEQTKTATPTTSSQTILPDTGYTLSSVTVKAVTSSIDNNIQASNIKDGVSILGVEGSFKDQADGIIDRTITILNTNTDLIGSTGLRDASRLVTVNAPNLQRISTYGFYGCSNLKNLNVNIDNKVDVTTNSFAGCTNLEGFDFEFSGINSTSFINCQKISKVICTDSVSQIATNSVFSGCLSLKTLVLRKTNVVTLRNVNSFENTPFRNGEGGIVYVPNDLISSYESATNWSSLESVTFKKIEGSIYE